MTTRWKSRQPRAKCPSCGRDVALLADGTVARMHLTPAPRRWCDGYGRNANPVQTEEMSTV